MRFAAVAVVLVAAVALTGCGKPVGDGGSTPPTTTSSTGTGPDPAEVQEIEDVVNGLDGVVGSAETEAETGND